MLSVHAIPLMMKSQIAGISNGPGAIAHVIPYALVIVFVPVIQTAVEAEAEAVDPIGIPINRRLIPHFISIKLNNILLYE
jgi:hypothetical protein